MIRADSSPLATSFVPLMASLRILALSRRSATLTPRLSFRRHASFYNTDIAGLTDEEAEVSLLVNPFRSNYMQG
jgi:hypothetical protein